MKKLNKSNANTTTVINKKVRKIGNTTFVVSVAVNTEKKRDVMSIISRLIESEKIA